ncbi:oligopeptide ABC transporter permease OppB [Govanella unica]|uniref:Oligopeptide ABC transporter permease OppB n=1 Tax=Govanella unica TaxID=2975056 RepID=A0A9X3TZH6_9PROT|nr:oligopeptide ABC transporter permease OppB [Govania unica]MDA5194826.1 oligopeptide ABC transporter permease OppB [Govania unica]
MWAYALRRGLAAIPTLFVIVTLAFFLMRVAPGGPFDAERTLPAEIEANIKAAYHLDKPLIVQYGIYVGNLLRGDFGPSYKYKDFTVGELIAAGFPVSLKIGGMAILLASLLGIAAGSLAALRQNSRVDHLVMGFAMTGIALPGYVVAPLLALAFGVYLKWLPVAGWNTGGWREMVLPVTALTLPYLAYIARLTRGSMIEVLHANYIRTARAKGLPMHRILTHHALKAALMPVVSFLGPAIAGIITGSVVIEQIFGLPGIGRYFVQGALNRDYTLVLGVVIFYAVLIMLLNLAVDLIYALLDPRVRYR